MKNTITMKLAEYAASSSSTALPSTVKERAKKVIFDEMACAYFGRRSTAGELTSKYAQNYRSIPESRILGTGLRVSAPFAAMANGAAGHGEEVDGAHVVGGHPGATLVHAAVAVSERQRAAGTELLNAVVLGYDVGVRLIAACGGTFPFQNRSHQHADFLHGIAASVASSRILGLAPIRHCHAMALATFQTNGLTALFQERRHVSKSFCNGQYAFAGVSAALMSSAGLEGCDDILGARDGVLDAWGHADSNFAVAHQLGEDYAINGANFKFLNAGYPIHAIIEAAETLVKTHEIQLTSIESVLVGMPAHAMNVVNNRQMHNICAQDMLSATLVRGGLTLSESPFPAILANPEYANMRMRIQLDVDPELERDQPHGRGARVSIRLTDGRTVSHRVDYPRGHSLRGEITWDDLFTKWRDELHGCDVKTVIALAQRLDELEDVSELTAAFRRISPS